MANISNLSTKFVCVYAFDSHLLYHEGRCKIFVTVCRFYVKLVTLTLKIIKKNYQISKLEIKIGRNSLPKGGPVSDICER